MLPARSEQKRQVRDSSEMSVQAQSFTTQVDEFIVEQIPDPDNVNDPGETLIICARL